jgi:hypothetical protein
MSYVLSKSVNQYHVVVSSGWALGFCSKDFYSSIIALCSESGVTSDAAVSLSKGLKSHTRY